MSISRWNTSNTCLYIYVRFIIKYIARFQINRSKVTFPKSDSKVRDKKSALFFQAKNCKRSFHFLAEREMQPQYTWHLSCPGESRGINANVTQTPFRLSSSLFSNIAAKQRLFLAFCFEKWSVNASQVSKYGWGVSKVVNSFARRGGKGQNFVWTYFLKIGWSAFC